jgi:Chaperone for flagella basal body P-ring formation
MWADKKSIAWRLLTGVCLLSAVQPAGCASPAISNWPIPQASVQAAIADFLHVHGWSELPETVSLQWAKSLTARAERVQLQVTGVVWDGRQQAPQFRLRCRQRSACGDFLVHLGLPPLLADEWQQRLVSPDSLRLISGGSPVSGPLLAQRGKPATLVLQGGGMQVSLPVICTEPGTLNQRIRVVDRHSQRIFYADVVGEGLLHAAL